MHNYNAEYFFLQKKEDDHFPFLVPNENTANRSFFYKEQPFGSPPLIFHNGWRKEDKKNKIVSITSDVLFCGNDLVIGPKIRNALLEVLSPGMTMHPAIYIDNNDNWHQDYWHLTFSERFDCWDREESEYNRDDPPIDLGEEPLHTIYNYSLDGKAIETRPLENRLLFKMGGAMPGMVVCHKNILPVFSDAAIGMDFTPIVEY